jgi:hypothetical protein
MPRRSADDTRRIVHLRGEHPQRPAGVSPEAAVLWQRIVAERPAGYFDAGNLPLLEMYCQAAGIARGIADLVARTPVLHPDAAAVEQRRTRMAAHLGMLAKKLRLTPQAQIDRRSRMLDETGLGEEAAADPLLGGKRCPRSHPCPRLPKRRAALVTRSAP